MGFAAANPVICYEIITFNFRNIYFKYFYENGKNNINRLIKD